MTTHADSIAGELIRWMEVPGKPQVFALGNFARQVTFAAPDSTSKSVASVDSDLGIDPYPSSIGTLGCFAKDKQGNIHLITASFVLALDKKGQIGDRIFVEGESFEQGHQPVATISNISPFDLIGDTVRLTTGVGSARLEPGVVPDYEPFRADWRIERVGSANLNDRVAKVGRTSGLTTGRVAEVGFAGSRRGIG